MQGNTFGHQPTPTAPPPEYPGYFVPNSAANQPPNYGDNFPHNQIPYQGPVVNQVYSPPIVVVAEPKSRRIRERQNKRQSKVVSAAFIILISGGMNIGFSIQALSILLTTHMRVCWFIGALIGALLSAILVNLISKKVLVQFASALVILGGVLTVAIRHNPQAVIASRYLDGIANGLVIALTLVLTGEIVVRNNRGSDACTEQVSVSGGIFMHFVFSSFLGYSGSFSAIQLQGICSIAYGIAALMMSSFMMLESPVLLLAKQREQEAIDVLRRLQRPQLVTTQTYELLDEHKRYLAENNELSFGQSATQGFPALIRLCLYRTLNAMSNSYVVSFSLFVLCEVRNQSAWPYIVFGGLRFVGSFIPAFMLDSFGRKKLVLIGSLLCSAMAFGFAATFNNSLSQLNSTETLIFLFIFTFFAGLVSTSSSAYLTEAFPLAVKHYFISAAFMVEMFVYLIICTISYSYRESVIDYFYILGAGWILFFLLGVWCLPETKQTTLREAQQKFKGFISKGF